MEKHTCSTCAHYLQHYVLNERKLIRIYCGHCTFLKAKTKRPHTEACKNYVRSDPNEEVFASKEYLSKELLEYILKLELLPEIYDGANKDAR